MNKLINIIDWLINKLIHYRNRLAIKYVDKTKQRKAKDLLLKLLNYDNVS